MRPIVPLIGALFTACRPSIIQQDLAHIAKRVIDDGKPVNEKEIRYDSDFRQGERAYELFVETRDTFLDKHKGKITYRIRVYTNHNKPRRMRYIFSPEGYNTYVTSERKKPVINLERFVDNDLNGIDPHDGDYVKSQGEDENTRVCNKDHCPDLETINKRHQYHTIQIREARKRSIRK